MLFQYDVRVCSSSLMSGPASRVLAAWVELGAAWPRQSRDNGRYFGRPKEASNSPQAGAQQFQRDRTHEPSGKRF